MTKQIQQYCTSIQISYTSHSSSCFPFPGGSLKQEFLDGWLQLLPVWFSHFSTMMYGVISTLTVALHKTKKQKKKNSHNFTSRHTQAVDHKDKHTKKDKTRSIQVYFKHSVLGWILPALEDVYFQSESRIILHWQTDLVEISFQAHSGSLFTHRNLEGWPFLSLTQESVNVMAKHSFASRHRWGFTDSLQIQLSPRWLLRQCCHLLLLQ